MLKLRDQAVRKKIEEQMRAIIHLQSGRLYGYHFDDHLAVLYCTILTVSFLQQSVAGWPEGVSFTSRN